MASRAQMLADGVNLMTFFCEFNGLPVPGLKVVTRENWRFGVCAFYRPQTVTICVEKCATIGTAARAWSYPGYVIDRTPYGVVAHELGHHVDHYRSAVKGAYGGDFSANLRRASGEPKLTNYCPNDWEWFAEMFRLFVTNSDLLRVVRPRTYALLIEAGFEPVIFVPWADVLKDAPPRTVEMAARKAK